MIDIIPFAISDFSQTFLKPTNQEVAFFKSQCILEALSFVDQGFIYNITHDSNNDVTRIVWMTSYMRDNFERFGNYLSIDVIRSSVCSAKKLLYCTSCKE